MSEEQEIRLLCHNLLNSWNQGNASAFAALFVEDGQTVGFDGSTHNGRAPIEIDLSRIFATHQTAAFVGKVKGVHFPSAEVAILSAVAGTGPSGKSDLNPTVNAIPSLVGARRTQRWFITLFHNTPAAFHDRPKLAEQLTEKLRQVPRTRKS